VPVPVLPVLLSPVVVLPVPVVPVVWAAAISGCAWKSTNEEITMITVMSFDMLTFLSFLF
jgi:hypothetical protein